MKKSGDASAAQSVSAKVRVSDYLADALVRHGVKHVFMLTGGGAMHLNDALARAPGLEVVCGHHEQALAMAAESYGRMSNRLACLNVTTGPGGINALNGVFGAYTDSIGMIVLSGQVKRETMRGNAGLALRQLGDQEADIVAMVRPITKMAEVLHNPLDARYLIEKALWLARTGRPGPVWIDVPIDVQAAPIDPTTLRGFDPVIEGYGQEFAVPSEYGRLRGAAVEKAAAEVLQELQRAERPAILVGAGVRLSGQHERFLVLAEKLGIPVATGWNAHDAMHDDHPCYAGRPSSVGDRAGNFTVQNADVLLILGSRLNIRQISYNYQSFARAAFKIMVDIDKAEMQKPTVSINMPVHADLAEFIPALAKAAQSYTSPKAHGEYLAWTQERRRKYPVILQEYWDTKGVVNPYCFAGALFEALNEGDRVVTADGTACVVTFQAAALKRGQRLYTNSGSASMGYELPAVLGAWHAQKTDRVICIAGDGSIMQNIQELATITGQKIPAKIFLLNNSGYHSIRQSQQAYFPDNVVGCGPDSGLNFPDFSQLCAAFGLAYARASTHDDMRGAIEATLSARGAALCEVMIDKNQVFAPKLSSRKLEDGTMVSSPLEDLAPFLPRDEFRSNMLIPPVE